MELNNPTEEHHRGNTTVYSCAYKVIFTPKYRRPVLINGIDVRLKELVQQIVADTNNVVLEMEIMPDHVHLLLDVNPDYGISKLIREIKGISSRTLRNEFPELKTQHYGLEVNSLHLLVLS